MQLDTTELETAAHLNGVVRILLRSNGNSSASELRLHAAENIFIERLQVEQQGKSTASVRRPPIAAVSAAADRVLVVNSVVRDTTIALVRAILDEHLVDGGV